MLCSCVTSQALQLAPQEATPRGPVMLKPTAHAFMQEGATCRLAGQAKPVWRACGAHAEGVCSTEAGTAGQACGGTEPVERTLTRQCPHAGACCCGGGRAAATAAQACAAGPSGHSAASPSCTASWPQRALRHSCSHAAGGAAGGAGRRCCAAAGADWSCLCCAVCGAAGSPPGSAAAGRCGRGSCL